MNKRLLFTISALMICATPFGFADTCQNYWQMSEVNLTTQAQKSPSLVYADINQCIANNSCSNSSNISQCTQNLNYYNSIAAFYYQKSLQSNVEAPIQSFNSAPQPVKSYNQLPPTQSISLPLNTSNSNGATTSNNNGTTTNSSSDIYKNIRF